MEHHIKKALSSCGVDYLEVRIEERSTTSVVYQGRELEQAGTSTSREAEEKLFTPANNKDGLCDRIKIVKVSNMTFDNIERKL